MLISKETTLQVFDNIPTINGLGLEPVIALRDVKEIIKAVPEADAVPVVHGKWLPKPDWKGNWFCSQCGGIQGRSKRFMRFCPNCGAKMDLEEQNASPQ